MGVRSQVDSTVDAGGPTVRHAGVEELVDLAVVVIGRNEGKDLTRCLRASTAESPLTVYADSGSSDGSMEIAERLGATALGLSRSAPFTAARGRNEGFKRAIQIAPHTKFVQFVDGDCELQPGWMKTAREFLQANPSAGIVCGQLRERFPERSIYNRLCEAEWKRPPGEILACGGIFMTRASVFESVGGFNGTIAAGEEYDLCLRLRRTGWTVWRSAESMAIHDAGLHALTDWWRRMMRTGGVAAEGAIRYQGEDAAPHLIKCLSTSAWVLSIPACLLVASLVDARALLFLIVFPLRIISWLAKGYPATYQYDVSGAVLLLFGTIAEFQGIVSGISRALTLALAKKLKIGR